MTRKQFTITDHEPIEKWDATDRYLASLSPVVAHSPLLARDAFIGAIAAARAALDANAETMGVSA